MYQINQQEADKFSSQLQTVQNQFWDTHRGVDPKIAGIFAWSTWKSHVNQPKDYILGSHQEIIALLRFEPDYFNSYCLKVSQARLHWLPGPGLYKTTFDITSTAKSLKELLGQLPWEMISLKILGTDSVATALFQRAGFRAILSNALMYRSAMQESPDETIRQDVEIRWVNLRDAPVDANYQEKLIEIADSSFFHDRFSLDINIDQKLVKNRFLQVTLNALMGDIAKYLLVATVNNNPEAILFFDVLETNSDSPFPNAGSWLTLLSRPSIRGKGLGVLLTAQAIRSLPEGLANWTISCAIDHFAVLHCARKLDFQIGSIAHDFHWWRNENETPTV